MSIPPQENDFSWHEVAPDEIDPVLKDHLARQVRIMLAAGKSRDQIIRWLCENDLSPTKASAFLAEFSSPGISDRWERLFGKASLGLIAVLSAAVLILVAVQRPWDEGRWKWRVASSSTWGLRPQVGEIPAVTGFLLFCLLYCISMIVLWFWATRVGGLMDRLQDKQRPRGLWIAVLFVPLLTILVLFTIIAMGAWQ